MSSRGSEEASIRTLTPARKILEIVLGGNGYRRSKQSWTGTPASTVSTPRSWSRLDQVPSGV